MCRIPRWTQTQVACVGTHDTAVSLELAQDLQRLADAMAVPLDSVLIAAHAKVLASLSGEHEVVTGYAIGAGERALRINTAARTWRELVQEAERAVAELHRSPTPEAPFEAAFDASPRAGGALHADVVLQVGVVRHDGLLLRLRYRTEALDGPGAARIGAYHLAALRWIVADPDAAHARHSLLSAAELRFQVDGLAGPPRPLPDARAHELFEDQVLAHPDAVAVASGEATWTYRQLNVHANQLAWALLARGLTSEGVVAVVTERNLAWCSAVLAILKAGGAYLPIEPHFPAERIGSMLSRAGCRLVLTERGSTATLDRALAALPGVQRVTIDAAWEEGHPGLNLGAAVERDQLAYIYFTSGSTGEPKGAMCEHAGLLNHLFAKIDDLCIQRETVVAQTAPQCFDISLWQLLSALMVGGTTLLVGQEAILDPPRFIDTIARARANVIQVVPSYLEVLLAELERNPRELTDLRFVSVTGEALKKELAQRWFAARPGIRLVNAYGLTETSDDTNHEIMTGAPRGERVPLGRPVNNVRAYVVDEHLQLVPLGAPGEIVFSGVCVGRGYVNDPERTLRVFMADPYREGQRLYRSGDYGRWLPEGKLEFLGRRDAQVKISGFRIETGDIENALLRAPGVREGAVIVTERGGRKQLVAFYGGEQPLDHDALRDALRRSLPAYMVPPEFHWLERLPLTANGKVDRKALAGLAAKPDAPRRGPERPVTATEQWLVRAWAEVLGLPLDRVGRGSHFFDLGGTSLSALRLVVRLNRAISLGDLKDHPVLANLAAMLDARAVPQARTAAANP